jgi:hypothetical protein
MHEDVVSTTLECSAEKSSLPYRAVAAVHVPTPHCAIVLGTPLREIRRIWNISCCSRALSNIVSFIVNPCYGSGIIMTCRTLLATGITESLEVAITNPYQQVADSRGLQYPRLACQLMQDLSHQRRVEHDHGYYSWVP